MLNAVCAQVTKTGELRFALWLGLFPPSECKIFALYSSQRTVKEENYRKCFLPTFSNYPFSKRSWIFSLI